MKYINQLDYPNLKYVTMTEMEETAKNAGQNTTIANSGCGLCSAIMAIDRILPNSQFSLEDAIEFSYQVEANILSGTQFYIYGPALAKRFAIKYEESKSIVRLKECLRTGGVAIARVAGNRDNYIGVFSKGKHYITIINVEPDGRLAVLDPSYKEGKYLEDGRKGKVEMKQSVIALCDEKVIEEDCLPHDPRYFLFWRE